MKSLRGNANGFTLTELLLVSAISLALIATVVTLQISYNRSYVIGTQYLDMAFNLRVALENMTRDIHSASQLVKTYGTYAASNNCLILAVPSVNASGIIIDNRFDVFIYRLQGTAINRIVISNPTSSRVNSSRNIAQGCNALNFNVNGASLDTMTATALSGAKYVSANIVFTKLARSITGAVKTLTENSNVTISLRNKV